MKWEGGESNQTAIIIGLTNDETRTKSININTAGLIDVVKSNPSPPPSGECRGSVDPSGYVPCDEITYGGYLNCMFPDTCTPCGCRCFMQCRDPIAGKIECSSLTEDLCNNCGCLWWSG